MATDKKSFVLYADSYSTIKQLPDEIAGRLLKHIFAYVNDENPQSDDLLLNIAFEPIKTALKRDLKKYEEKKVERSLSGRLGNLKRYNLDLYEKVSRNELTLEDAEKVAISRKSSLSENFVAKLADSVNESVSVSDSVILLEKETKEDLLSEAEFSEEVEPEKEERKKVALKKERFSPPTVQEVQEYCNERQNGIQAYAFVNFYQSKGWFIGKNKMKDWRAAIRTWENKNKENENGNTKTNAGSSASEGKSRFSKFTVDDFIIPTENY